MRIPPSLRTILRILFIGFLIFSIPFMALFVISSGPFGDLRRQIAEHFLSKAADVDVAVKGTVRIGFGLSPKVSIRDVVGIKSDVPSNIEVLTVRKVDLKLPIIPLLTGDLQLSGLVINGLKVVISVPQGETSEAKGTPQIGEFISGIVHSPAARDFELHDTDLEVIDHESGFTLRYAFDALVSRAKDDGSVEVDATGTLNDEPWKLDGDADPPLPGDKRKFDFTVEHAGLTAGFAGLYTFADAGDAVDMAVTFKTPAIERFLKVYEIDGDIRGSSDLSGRVKGAVDAPTLSDLALKIALESGTSYTLTGGIGDVAAMSGLDLQLAGSFPQDELPKGKTAPLFDIAITGFNGHIEGTYKGVLVRDFRISTNSVNATLNDFGPISAERLYKNEQGQLGLYGLLILAGDPKRPSVRVTGTVKDIIDIQGIDLEGQVDFLTADFFDLAADEHASELGHLTGSVAISDADGSLGIESFSAKVTDSNLLTLSLDLVFDDLSKGDALKIATHLDIPKFDAFAKALGSQGATVGRIKFDGSVAGGNNNVQLAGTALIGETTIKGDLKGEMSGDEPILAGTLTSPLLHLSDMQKLNAVNATYFSNIDDTDIDVIDYSGFAEALLVKLKIDVAKIAGGGEGASNFKGNVTYQRGVVGLDPLSLTYLGGRATSSGKIDTNADPNTFSLNGRVERLPIGKILNELGGGTPVRGSLHATYDITGAGNSMTDLSRSLSGSVTSSLRNGWIGSNLINLTGMSLPAWLLSRSSGGTELVCVVAPFSFTNGRGSTRALVLETREVQIVGVGYVDLRRNVLDLRFKPQPLRQKLIEVTQPFSIQGSLKDPQVRLKGAPIANAVAGTFAFPFNVLDSIVQPRAGTPGRVPCKITQTAARQEPRTETRRENRGPLGLGGIFGGNAERNGDRRRAPQRNFGPRR